MLNQHLYLQTTTAVVVEGLGAAAEAVLTAGVEAEIEAGAEVCVCSCFLYGHK